MITPREKRIVAYHEAGHALIAESREFADPVAKVSIIPRGVAALGYTQQLPTEDRYLLTRRELLERLDVLLGGRVAEEIVFGDISTGAQDDLQRATDLVRHMITRYGMSDVLGPMVYAENEGEIFLGRSITKTTHVSEETMRKVDGEIRRIIDEQYALARRLIEENRDKVEEMAKALLEWETIDGEQIDDILAGKPPRPPKSTSATPPTGGKSASGGVEGAAQPA